MRPMLPCLALTTLSLPATAQDIGAEYLAAHMIFGSTSMELDTSLPAISALIQTLEGNWVSIDILYGDPPDMTAMGAVTAEMMQMYCSRIVFGLRPTGPHSFDLVQHDVANKDAPVLTIHHGYTGFNSFQRYVDEAELLERMGMTDRPDAMPNMFIANRNNARVNLYVTSPNIMVMTHTGGLTEYFARCP